MEFQSQLDEISSLLFSHGLRQQRFAADYPLPLGELQYHPLQPFEIRLLRIPLYTFNEKLELTLGHYICDSDYRCVEAYTALSYCWGDASDTVPILVNNSRLAITRSLQAALRELKRREYEYVWIDAICINQNDNEERGHQILKMRNIYHNAQATVVWLGEEDKHTKKAFDMCNILKGDFSKYLFITEVVESPFIKRIKELSGNHPEKLKILEGWESLAALIALPYWARTWIIQEVAISSSATLLWGSQTMDIDTLRLSLETLRKYSPTIWSYFEGIEHITGLVSLRKSVDDVRRRVHAIETSSAEDLLGVLSLSCLSKASELRDKVFGVLGLAHDGPRTIPEPDYEEPMESIVRAITLKKLTIPCPEQVMDVICLDHGRIPRRENLPSWVVDWTSLWDQPDGNIWTSRAIRFLSTSDVTRYRACAQSRASVEISSDESTLTCCGYHFDTIRGLSTFDSRTGFEEAEFDTTPKVPPVKRLLIHKNIYGSELELLKAIWLSSIHNPMRDGTGKTTASPIHSLQNLFSEEVRKPAWVESTWMDVIKEAGQFKIYGRKLNEWFGPSRRNLSSLENTNACKTTEYIDQGDRETYFWDSIQIGRFGRRLMETDLGYVGTAHSQAHVGDSIALLQGASVPIILRPCNGGYRVVGEAYVHGIMEGEFWEAQDESQMQTFRLK
ncbi:heterokaryon incompatibility protein-domain-containing protein [Cadophora sp. MPI-SDFR-AT-0126]|nr:heterokaryon incompatibility protein-domain-containing protein [Leotiomycetes sp. MPI-SDFR-AT-0126]